MQEWREKFAEMVEGDKDAEVKSEQEADTKTQEIIFVEFTCRW